MFFERGKKKHSYDRVNIELWTSSLDRSTYEFIQDFSQYHVKIKGELDIAPHFALWFCVHCRDNAYEVDNIMCLSGGRYCAPNSSNFVFLYVFYDKLLCFFHIFLINHGTF